jgi:2-amino-4-hydroxy-6-hydroxymethyldihydropteridine diphosphokinase
MILVGLGSNLPGVWGSPRETVLRAFDALHGGPVKVVKVSSLLITSPMGPQNQPDYVNAVAVLETHLPPEALLRRLHMIERQAGRSRRLRWGPRTLDLDLLAYHQLVRVRKGLAIKPLALPHPGLHERSFVLQPLQEIAPKWRHPVLRMTVQEMVRRLG